MVPRPPLDRFVSALHRRLLVVRALETMAFGAAAGAAAGAAIVPLLYWRAVPAFTPTLAALALGASTGLLWGLTRRPTRLEAAAEADRQLDLADLLGTALTVGRGARTAAPDEGATPWLQTVQSLADAACDKHTPSQVILYRLNARAWGGVALAAALVLSLAALAHPEPTARAAAIPAPAKVAQRSARPLPNTPDQGTARSGNSHQPSRSPGTGPEREGERDGASSAMARGADAAAKAEPADSAKNSASAGDDGQGGGSARARTPAAGDRSPPPHAAPAGSPPSPEGDASGGAGASTTRGTARGPNSTGTVGGMPPGTPAAVPPTPPWDRPTWTDDARRAREALDARRVPDARRDLVREYFDREYLHRP